MKKLLFLSLALSLVAGFAFAQDELNGPNVHKFYARGYARPGGGGGQNLVDHGGAVLNAPKVVFIFWGWSSGDAYTSELQSFRDTGMYDHTRMLTQYRTAAAGADALFGGSGNDKFDGRTPPTNVTDADVQAEVKFFFHGNYDSSTIYEVVIPNGHYSSDGSSTSCGGPSLAYCAYHGNFSDGADVKYSIQPYASCGGCQTAGFDATKNQEHFVIHETREAVSDPDLNAWYDRRGNEADDKCAWSPTPFIDSNGFAYQYEWSNSAGGCVQR